MTHRVRTRAGQCLAAALISLAVAASPALGKTVAQKKALARAQFEDAERMRRDLQEQPAGERTPRDYREVIEAYRKVYYLAPSSAKADASVFALGELLAEQGRAFHDKKLLQAAVGQYEFLRREYPGSRFRMEALFNIGEICQDDLGDSDKARSSFQEFLRRYPDNPLAGEARAALSPRDAGATRTREAKTQPEETKAEAASEKPEPAAKLAVSKRQNRPLMTAIRHWSTPEYTRVAIDLDAEVKFEGARVDHPDRIYFDLHNTRVPAALAGKSLEVEDGLLKKIRVAQFQPGETRVVLEVRDAGEYSASLLPNPYRLMVEIRSRKRGKVLARATPAPAAKDVPAESETEPARKPEAAALTSREQKATEDSANKPGAAARAASKMTPSAAPAAAAEDSESTAESREADDEVTVRTIQPKPSSGGEQSSSGASARGTVAMLDVPPETDATSAPEKPGKPGRLKGKKPVEDAGGREARPTSNGERSLVRALGLKIGRIVVDAGHGGHDTGTIGPNGLMEKDLVLDVSLRLGKLLERRLGAEVTYTRDDDTFIPLEERTAIANQNQADLFISVHANSSSDASARGVETYYLNFSSSADALEVAARENAASDKSIHELQDLVKKIALKDKIEESREFAADVQQALYNGLSTRNGGLRNRGVKKAPFIVLIGANMPSILAEISFVSNPADAHRLQTPEYRQKIAEALYRGIAKYAGGLSGVRVAARGAKREAE